VNAKLWLAAGALFLALSAVAVYKAWPLLFPEVIISAEPDPSCDLRAGPCVTRLADGAEVRFGIEPRDIPVLQPLQLSVVVSGMEVLGAEVDFVGIGMNMGFNRPKLDALGEGRFSGGATLPVCVRNTMQWEARVLLKTSEGLVSVPYRFVTTKSDH